MRFLKRCTPTEYKEKLQRADEEENERHQEFEDRAGKVKARGLEKMRKDAKLRQRRHREQEYKKQISLGERSPGGTK
jgi:hypothetical protein